MTRHRWYYPRQSDALREAKTRVRSIGRLENALSSGEPGPGALRGSTVLQVFALAVLALAHFFDYASFLLLIGKHGLAAEANPVVVRIAEEAGLPGLTIAKVATVTFAALLMILIAPRRKRLAMGLFMFGVGAGLLGGITNVASL